MLFTSMNTVKNIFPVSQKLSLCYNKIPCVFPVWKKLEPNSLCRGHPVIRFHLYQSEVSFLKIYIHYTDFSETDWSAQPSLA